MNKILLTSICSLVVSVPSGFLIYQVSDRSEAEKEKTRKMLNVTNNETRVLPRKSKVEGTNRYLFGQIKSDINKDIVKSTNPLTFTCAMSGGKACSVKMLNLTKLIKKNKLEFTEIDDFFIDVTKEQLTKGTYVQVGLSNEDELNHQSTTETITIAGSDTTFTIQLEDWTDNSFISNQEKLIKQTITQIQEAYDVDNSRYCLIKMPNEINVTNYQNSLLFPRNKENSSVFTWIIDNRANYHVNQRAELYEIADQNKIVRKGTKLDKTYFDTQNKFIQTVDQLKKQKSKWVKIVIQDKNIDCQIELIGLRKTTNKVFYEYISEYHEITQ